MKARVRLGAAAAVLAISVALGGPAGAAAKPGYEVQNRSLRLALEAPAANGYRLKVETLGHRQVTLTLSHEDRFAIYRTTGRVSRRGIEADLGRLGRISVRFAGERRPFELFPGLDIPLPPGLGFPQRDCRGRRPVREVGVFRGAIRFAGELGFTHLRTHRARGEVRRAYRRVCKRGTGGFGRLGGEAGPLGAARVNYLAAVERSGSRTVAFEALGFEFGPELEDLEALFGTLSLASIRERREGMRILRLASVFGDAGSLLVSPPRAMPATATVALPRPIDGTAEYAKEVGSPPSWVGSLQARLPGAGVVPLVGPGFSATLCRLRFDDLLPPLEHRCLRRSGIPLPGAFVTGAGIPAQISGSQSQLFGDARLSWSR